MNVLALPHPKLCHEVRARVLARLGDADTRTRRKAVNVAICQLRDGSSAAWAIAAALKCGRSLRRTQDDAA
jgi:HD superfamily phosphodiesterase